MSSSIVLAFSGGLDTSYCIPYLRETTGREIVTVTVDTGGLDAAAIQELEKRALALGAQEHHRIDARDLFFDQVLRPLIFGNVRRGHLYPLCVGSERVLQAQQVAEMAKRLGARAIGHGCTAAGNDQIRFEVALRTLDPELEILAPVRDDPKPRAEQVAFLEKRGLPVPPHGAAYSVNRGLWGVTVGGRETLDSKTTIPESAWPLSAGAFEDPAPAETMTLGFEKGIPVSIDGTAHGPVALLESLERRGARFAIGRGIHLGDTVLGIKGRVAFEAPAAEIVLTAHRELEKLTLTARQLRLKDQVAPIYGDLVHEGQLLDPVCRDIERFLASTQERVTGTVTLQLRPGSLFVEGVQSPSSLFAATRGQYGEAAGEWSAADALGFARLSALPGLLYRRAGEGQPS
ncbi:MAG: argininosuccinate synthase [Planctomycetota bacterium]